MKENQKKNDIYFPTSLLKYEVKKMWFLNSGQDLLLFLLHAFAINHVINREPQNQSKTSREGTCLLQTDPTGARFKKLVVDLGSCIMD